MLDWTDRHFRLFLRLICRRPMLYTEMIACNALILGQREKLLAHRPEEQPLALQVGGSDPALMAQCARLAEEAGYREVNINAGCPSSRVQAGRFGAILMETPELVAACVAEMTAKAAIPVTVKTRISLAGAADGFEALFRMAQLVRQAGCRHLIVHARQARLNWSPHDNRERLPLDYQTVYRLKQSFPDMRITLNGGVSSLAEAAEHLRFVDGVMIGRKAYGNPYMLIAADSLFFQDAHPVLSRAEILEAYLPYMERNKEAWPLVGGHILGLFHGQPHAKEYRQAVISRDPNVLRVFIARLGEK